MKSENMEFNILLNNKLQKMYDENKISGIERDYDLRDYVDIYKKAFKSAKNFKDFSDFEWNGIQHGGEFLEIDKDHYSMNEFAQEVAEYMFDEGLKETK